MAFALHFWISAIPYSGSCRAATLAFFLINGIFIRADKANKLSMVYESLDNFLSKDGSRLGKGPIAVIIDEDLVETQRTIEHHLNLGFSSVLLLSPKPETAEGIFDKSVKVIKADTLSENITSESVNAVIQAAPDAWIYYCYNAEFLFFPFCETRTVGEMMAFNAEERRSSVLTYVIDLYADNLDAAPNAVSPDRAHLDKSGYYALAREDANFEPLDRQLDFYGGLRWRFEEHVPWERRRIDRISLFRSKRGLKLLENHTFNEPEYNTFACPWHNNVTAAITSFRTAKALKKNPSSKFQIQTFHWRNSTPFEWHSNQLMQLGLMEPGQWF